MTKKAARKYGRRDFLTQTLYPTFGALVLQPTLGSMGILNQLARAATLPAGTKKTGKYLVNINCAAGWDSVWMHAGFSLTALKNTGKVDIIDGRALNPASDYNPFKFSPRFDDTKGAFFASSNGNSAFLGSDWVNIFGADGSFLSQNMAIVKGMLFGGGHVVGNTINNMGSTSPYAMSYSAIVAGVLAVSDYPRPLHYVSIANGPLFSTTNLNIGYQVPMCIPDLPTFQALCSPPFLGSTDPKDGVSQYSPATLAGAPGTLEAALIAKSSVALGSALNKSLALTSSRTALSTFGVNQQTRGLIQTAGWATSLDLQLSRLRFAACADRMIQAFGNPSMGIDAVYQANLTAISHYRQGIGTSQEVTQLSQAFKDNPTFEASMALLAYYPGTAPPVVGTGGSDSVVFSFAFADFLIRNDLTAVIDLAIGVGDTHIANSGHFNRFFTSLAFAMAHELITSLKEIQAIAPTDGPAGQSLFDRTLIVLQTEMDRNPWNNANSAASTDHDLGVTSMVLAGYGIKTGVVGGAVMDAPQISNPAGYPASAGSVGSPLPVNAAGVADPNGERLDAISIMPTIVAALGVTLPARDQTSHGPLKFVLK